MTKFIFEVGDYMFQKHPFLDIFGIYTVVKVDGYPLRCIGSSWPVTNKSPPFGSGKPSTFQVVSIWIEDFGGVGLESPLFGESIQLLKDLVLNARLQNSSPSTKGTNKYVNILEGFRIRILYDIMYQEFGTHIIKNSTSSSNHKQENMVKLKEL